MFTDYTEEQIEELEKRFWKKVDNQTDPSGCWVWTAAGNEQGYGHIGINGKTRLSHRVSWALHYGSIPEGCHVLHHCDNPSCVKPTHLFLGTPQENMRDKRNKRRAYKKLSPEQVSEIRTLYNTTDLNQTDLAGRYGVSQRYISYLVRGERR